MFCPNCKCEYIRGVTECSDCGVPLVDTLDSLEVKAPNKNDVLVTIWAGNDPGESTAIKEALQNAGISFTDKGESFNSIFPSMENKYEVLVPSQDQEEARKVLFDLDARIHPDELTSEELESLALPVSEDEQDQQMDAPDDIPEDWDDEAEGAEVWSGEKEDLANMLMACLREIGIPSRKVAEAGHWSIQVPPEQELRAKEVVREVAEASPPE